MRVSRSSTIPTTVVIIPPITNRKEESPVGASPPFDSIGISVTIKIGVGVRVWVRVRVIVGLEVGVADSYT